MDRRERTYELVARTLDHLGHTTVFGLLGSGNFLYTNHLVSNLGGRLVWVRNESAAVAAAATYAQVTGRLGVATVHQGPGLTNTLTTLTHAARERSPVLLIAGETGVGREVNQTVDLEAIATVAGAGVERITNATTAADVIARAVSRALYERRPIVVGIPVDIQAQEIAEQEIRVRGDIEIQRVSPGVDEIQAAANLVQASTKPLILGGRGAVLSDAGSVLGALGDRIGALYATSLVANGLFKDDPASLGVSGGFSSTLAAEIIPDADLVLAFGASLNQWTTMHGRLIDRSKVVLFDSDPSALHDDRFRLRIHGDAAKSAVALTEELDRRQHRAPGYRGSETEARLQSYVAHDDFTEVKVPGQVDPRAVVVELDRLLPQERTVTYDSGHFHWFPTPFITVPDAKGFVAAQAFQSVGIGLGVALGAAVARPDRVTLLFIGDGGTLMHLGELDALIAQQARTVITILNDGAYGAEVHHFEPMGFSSDLVNFGDRDFAAVGKALGASAVKIRSVGELQPAVSDWLADGVGPLILDCKVNPDVRSERLQEAFHQE